MGSDWTAPIRAGKAELSVDAILNSGKIKGVAGKPIQVSMWPLGGKNRAVPPIQPHIILFEGDAINYEDFVYDWVNTFTGTGGLKLDYITLRDKFFYTEASGLGGSMETKLSTQRNQAKEYLIAVQNLKTVIVNIESDLEKLNEQLKAFQDGDWEQIRAIFSDNYGGPQRSFTALVRNLPMAAMALTWFYRLKIPHPDAIPIKDYANLYVSSILPAGKYIKDKKTQAEKEAEISKKLASLKKEIQEGATKNKKAQLENVDQLVKDEQMNPALANFLKRKLEEFWNWVPNYVEWLTNNYNRIYENLIQQKANLKLYMRWAADHILKSKRLEMEPGLAESFGEYLHKGSPREAVMKEYIFYPTADNRPDIVERCDPWIPVIFTTFMTALNVEVNTKYLEGLFILHYGYTHKGLIDEIKSLKSATSHDLISIMLDAGAVTEEELPKLFSQEEIAELKGEKKTERTKSISEKKEELFSTIGSALWNFAEFFGVSLDKRGIPWTRQMRAGSIAMDLALKGIRAFKKSNGMLVLE